MKVKHQAEEIAKAVTAARRSMNHGRAVEKKRALEGGCGVIGLIASEKLSGNSIIRPCEQMRNRGNGKGGGVAAVGLFDEYRNEYALHIAYLDDEARLPVERDYVRAVFDVAHAELQVSLDDCREAGLEVKPPLVWRYFVRVKQEMIDAFAERNGITDEGAAEDECVFQNSIRLNAEFYENRKDPKAFVLSHGRNLMILKGVGYAEEIARYYRLEETRAHLWIGHQRYPTRGRVWHPGGAHPFAGLHEALVHNGDFANYHAVCEYLRQWGLVPQFTTDTEVSVLLFDLYSRVLGYPLEFVIEALAPTPDGDFERLSKRRQRIYRAIQSAHLHGSPDGPWFFIVGRAEPDSGAPQLIGITDVSMLRPQVFSLQEGENSFGAVASEKQALDAFYEDVAAEISGVPPLADHYWAARGGSCTDGGAFVYTLKQAGGRKVLDIRDKFGSPIAGKENGGDGSLSRPKAAKLKRSVNGRGRSLLENEKNSFGIAGRESGGGQEYRRETTADPFKGRSRELQRALQNNDFEAFRALTNRMIAEEGIREGLRQLTLLRDRRWDPLKGRRTFQAAAVDEAIRGILDSVPSPLDNGGGLIRIDAAWGWDKPVPHPGRSTHALVIDAAGFPNEGSQAVCRAIVRFHAGGWRNFIIYRCRGDRFIGCGLGPDTGDVRIHVYGSSGDYLGSGLDGAHIHVHGDAQDQVGQILKSGRIVVFGDVGQTFLYGAKGGEAFVMGSAAGRPLINAVGKIRAIINGTCLDYCAESFMAGEQIGGGFVIINGLAFDGRGEVIGLEMKYPGNNLFSLASGGACYMNDPYFTVTEGQLNGAEFLPFRREDWTTIYPYLKENGRLFGISIRNDLLMVDGVLKWPEEVFRKIVASRETRALDWTSLD